MNLKDIHKSRIQILNDLGLRRGAFVLYWMQQSQRAEYNHALEYAIQQANKMGQGVVVVFGLMDDYPEANLRHYTFMLEGLQETQAALAKRGIKMVVQKGCRPKGLPDRVRSRLPQASKAVAPKSRPKCRLPGGSD
jgi:deoxyribodipyrimidine photo-lyase